ncbi:MAG: D-serine deaminase-like pyridoxal phosphate-dependent protein [Saprospiraceae bacterium]|jgi:D-serine deaminase-like pyridoxal phosphate-dependent protein
MTNDWHQIDFSNTDSPALIIDRKKVTYNIQLAIKIAGGTDKLRPHVKTHKMLEVAKMQVEAGIYKFKCATIAEAEMLGMAGAMDVIIAYPVQGPKIDRVFALMGKFPKTSYSVLIDNIDTVNLINEKCKASGKSINVYIDVNNGQYRTGIILEKIPALVTACQQLSPITIIGLHCYDGHIRVSSLGERTSACLDAFAAVLALRKQLQKTLQKDLVIVAGGSPSFSVHAKYHEVECSPGTFIFWDQRYGNDYKEQAFQKAAVVATRVISKLDAHTYCLDLGHKSIASEMPFPRVAFLHPEKFTQIGHSEEHLVIQSEQADILNPGDLLLAYPYHICPTVALYDYAQIVSEGHIIDQWEVIARNRKITI